uniref:Uncharacterized protein n=1 Tax=Homo sapiens TaxID=9606 RepID=A0A9L9PXS7_HUMAN
MFLQKELVCSPLIADQLPWVLLMTQESFA